MTTYFHVYRCSNPECQHEVYSYQGVEKPEKERFCEDCGHKLNVVSTEIYLEKEHKTVPLTEVKKTSKIKFEINSDSIILDENKKIIKVNPESIGGKLNFSIEEINEFPELNETQLPNNIQLKQTKPECTLKDRFCINYGGKHCCLRLLHEKPEGDRKAIFELFQCEFEGANVEETEGFMVNT